MQPLPHRHLLDRLRAHQQRNLCPLRTRHLRDRQRPPRQHQVHPLWHRHVLNRLGRSSVDHMHPLLSVRDRPVQRVQLQKLGQYSVRALCQSSGFKPLSQIHVYQRGMGRRSILLMVLQCGFFVPEQCSIWQSWLLRDTSRRLFMGILWCQVCLSAKFQDPFDDARNTGRLHVQRWLHRGGRVEHDLAKLSNRCAAGTPRRLGRCELQGLPVWHVQHRGWPHAIQPVPGLRGRDVLDGPGCQRGGPLHIVSGGDVPDGLRGVLLGVLPQLPGRHVPESDGGHVLASLRGLPGGHLSNGCRGKLFPGLRALSRRKVPDRVRFYISGGLRGLSGWHIPDGARDHHRSSMPALPRGHVPDWRRLQLRQRVCGLPSGHVPNRVWDRLLRGLPALSGWDVPVGCGF